jgi:hypothetical protein
MAEFDLKAFAEDVVHEARRGTVTVYWRPRHARVCKTRDTAIEDRFAGYVIGVYTQGVPLSWVLEDVSYYLTMRALDRAMAA